MYNETKIAVKKAFEIGSILFSMRREEYKRLVKVTSEIKFPTDVEIKPYIDNGYNKEDAISILLRNRYKEIAVKNGFTEQQGIAILNYAAMLEEIR